MIHISKKQPNCYRGLLYAIAVVVNGTGTSKLRVFPHSYLSRHRSGWYSPEDPSLLGGPDQLVVTYRLNCGELNDDELEEIIGRMPADYTGTVQVRHILESRAR